MYRSAATLGTAFLLSLELFALTLEDLDQLPPLPIETDAKKDAFNLEPKSFAPRTDFSTAPTQTKQEPSAFPQTQQPIGIEKVNNKTSSDKNDLKKNNPTPTDHSIAQDQQNETQEKDKELNFEEDKEPSFTNIDSKGTIFVYLTLLIAGISFMILWYKKQISGKIKPNKGLSVDILGQTWLDGQTKLLFVKLGNKVIVLAKSQQFCNNIDTITDPEQIKLLTLGAGAAESGEDFGKILEQMQPKTSKGAPNEAQIKKELEQLKKELGHLGNTP